MTPSCLVPGSGPGMIKNTASCGAGTRQKRCGSGLVSLHVKAVLGLSTLLSLRTGWPTEAHHTLARRVFKVSEHHNIS